MDGGVGDDAVPVQGEQGEDVFVVQVRAPGLDDGRVGHVVLEELPLIDRDPLEEPHQRGFIPGLEGTDRKAAFGLSGVPFQNLFHGAILYPEVNGPTIDFRL